MRQAIQVIVSPFNAVAVAKAIVNRMAEKGPLEGLLETHYFGDGTIKTTSIVSYALCHIVSFRGKTPQHSLFNLWKDEDRSKLQDSDDLSAWGKYVTFCTNELNSYLLGLKLEIHGHGLWTPDKKKSKALTITAINGLIYCFRLLISNGKTGDTDYYRQCFSKIAINFAPTHFTYRSSHWKSVGLRIAKECFGIDDSHTS